MLVIEVTGIVKIFCAGGTALHAGAALDADAVDLRHIGGVDAAHGTADGAQAAAAAFCHVRSGLDLQNVDGRAVTVAGGVVGAERLLPRHGDGDGAIRSKSF